MRNIPENNFAYPVLVQLDTGSTGSGFFLSTDKKTFLITAKHILFDREGKTRDRKLNLTCQTEDLNDTRIIQYQIDLTKVKPQKHATADVAAIELGLVQKNQADEYSLKLHHGVEAKTSADGAVSVDAQNSTKLLDEVLVSNDVFLYGYPSSLGLRNSPQFDYNKPLLRKGIIANLYKDKGTIILDCPVYYGNSGGPVVEVDQNGTEFGHKVIGVVSEFIPFVEEWKNQQNGLVNTEFSNSGYSVAVAMDKVFELIDFKKN